MFQDKCWVVDEKTVSPDINHYVFSHLTRWSLGAFSRGWVPKLRQPHPWDYANPELIYILVCCSTHFFFFFRCFPVFYRSSKAYLEPSQTSIDLFIIDAQLNFHCPPLKDWLINRFKSSQRKITHPLPFFLWLKGKTKGNEKIMICFVRSMFV